MAEHPNPNLLPWLGVALAAWMAWRDASIATIATVAAAPTALWLALLLASWNWQAYQAWQARERLARDDGDWMDLLDYLAWRLRFWDLFHPRTSLQTRIGSIGEAVRPAGSGGSSAHPRAVYPLFRWVRAGESVDALALCVAAGVSDAELLGHLNGARPLDLEQVALMAALRGPTGA